MPVKPEHREEIILSTTHADRHGTQMSKEALISALKFINGDVKPRLGIEHDMTVPPMGRINDADIKQGEDGEFYLVGFREYYEVREAITLKNGSVLIKERFEDEQFKFVEVEREPVEKTKILVDRTNFNSYQDAENFINELREENDLEFDTLDLMRKSLIPDPEVVIELSKVAALYFIGKELLPKITGKISEDIAEDISKLYKLFKSTIIKTAKSVIPKNRPITYLVRINGDINIELIVISPKPNDLAIAITKEKLKSVVSQIESFNGLFGIDKIQFILNEEGEWVFNYALTSKGEALGIEKAFDKRDKLFKELVAKSIDRANEKSEEGSSEQSIKRQ